MRVESAPSVLIRVHPWFHPLGRVWLRVPWCPFVVSLGLRFFESGGRFAYARAVES
jgi:hypothetical protein